MHHSHTPLFLLAMLVACSQPQPGWDGVTKPPPTTETSPTTPTQTITTSTPTPTDTAPPVDTGVPVFDCASIPITHQGERAVPGAVGYHGLAFDAYDRIVGQDNSDNLLAVDSSGNVTPWVTSLGTLEQIAFTPNGNLVVAEWSRMSTISPIGAVTTLNGSVGNVYGVVLGPDDMLYLADWSQVLRMDPNTGTVEVVVANGWSPKVVAFNHDASALFFGTISNSGRVYRVDLDANMNPVSPPTLIGSTPGSWHDGLGVDICGNVYIAEYNNRSLYRIGVTSNQLQTVYAPSNDKYGHGLVWGTGSGGWNDHALYLPQPYNGNTVVEIDIGVPPAGYPATPTGISPI